MRIEQCADEADTAKRAAAWIAAQARAAVAARGLFTLAVSGGKTPWIMLRELVHEAVPWEGVHIFQIDERVAPDGDPDRNWTHLIAALAEATDLDPARMHAMPVTAADLDVAAADYAATLARITGRPAILDVVHLGLGTDGHTASLVPEDAALQVTDRDVAVTGLYQGRRRMTLTYPLLDRARQVLWLATGSAKVPMLKRLLTADPTIPAGRVAQTHATLFTDQPSCTNQPS
jgi:6-phosphogluconolactonase